MAMNTPDGTGDFDDDDQKEEESKAAWIKEESNPEKTINIQMTHIFYLEWHNTLHKDIIIPLICCSYSI